MLIVRKEFVFFLICQRVLRYLIIILANLRFFFGDLLQTTLSQPLTYLIVLTCFLAIDFRNFNLKLYIILSIGILSSIILGGPSLGLIIIFLAGSILANEDIRYLSVLSLFLQLLFLIIMTLLLGGGEIIEKVGISEKGITHDYGFGNSNVFSSFIASIIFTFFLIVLKSSKKIPIVFISLPVIIFAFLYSRGRSYFIGEIVSIIFIILLCMNSKLTYKLKYPISLFPIIFITIVLVFITTTFQFDLFNEILTGRPRLWANHFAYFITQGNIWVGYDYMPIYDESLDCSYMALLVNNGIIGYLIYSIFLYKGITKCYKFYRYYIPLIAGIFIIGIMENVLLPLSPINILFITLMFKCNLNYNTNEIYKKNAVNNHSCI